MKIVIHIPDQTLSLHGEDGAVIRRYGVSTAATAAHQHSFDMPATASTSAGGGQAHANMPPFYVLAYIVRVQ
jgi:microcystin-dependent protein